MDFNEDYKTKCLGNNAYIVLMCGHIKLIVANLRYIWK